MYKKLTRVNDNKLLGGICTGLGKYLEIDPVIIRVVFLVLFFFAGGGLLLYIIMWIIIPEERNVLPPHEQQNANTSAGV
ncbi:MAG: PspC domain-containing protein [Bacteroidales bacterium]|nr:PspC domain-containing protein [Bacteroidales bacterium]